MEGKSGKTASNRKPAPDFSLKDAEGKTLKLSDFRGKVVLLNFWATWCGPCALEIPWFVEFQQQFKNRGLEIVGVSMDEEGWTAVKPYIAQHKINYHVLLGNDSVSQLYGGVDSLPTTFIIDRSGRIAITPHVGLAEKNEYLQEIENALNENSSGASSADGRLFVPGLLRLGPTERE
jgi:peroxiredoxin